MKEALHKVNYANSKVNVCMSETVLGRKDLSERIGMIFFAYDLGKQEMAKELLQFVWKLVTVKISEEKIKLRLERSIKKCHLISSKINYSTFLI